MSVEGLAQQALQPLLARVPWIIKSVARAVTTVRGKSRHIPTRQLLSSTLAWVIVGTCCWTSVLVGARRAYHGLQRNAPAQADHEVEAVATLPQTHGD